MPRVTTVSSAGGGTITTTTETIIATIPGVTTTGPGQSVTLSVAGVLTTGASVNQLTYKCYRSATITGSPIGNNVVVAASASAATPVLAEFLDTPGELANQTYIITATQGAATGNGSAGATVATAVVGTPF